MSAGARLEVLVAGDLFLDLVMSGFPSWPRMGEESLAREFYKEAGGGAAITACGLSKLGIRTGVAGVVGKEDGQWMLQRLSGLGVNIDGIRLTAAQPTAFTVSVSTKTDRTFLTYGGANRELPSLLDELMREGGLKQARHVHMAHAMDPATLQNSLEVLTDAGRTISMDIGWHPEWYADARAISALQRVDVFFPNEREGEIITRERDSRRMLQSFEDMGLRRVALKLGQAGAALLWDGAIFFQPPGNIEPVDTTGAGDCFDAGFLYAWLAGMDPQMCLRAGVACGELSARAMGGIAGFPTREELEAILCTAK
jgi:sugar/nucleoside kinase (ribokinase family)